MSERNNSRGTYVTILRALFRGPDFQQLKPSARWTFIVLKANIGGMAGIDHVYPAELDAILQAETGHSAERVAEDLAALNGTWIRREGTVVWVVDHLTYDPHAHVGDAKKRKSVQHHVSGLPRLPIVRAFIHHHPDWFPADECRKSHLEWAIGEESGETLGRLYGESTNNNNNNSNSNTDSGTVVPKRGRRGPKTYSAQVEQLRKEYPKRSGSDPWPDAATQIEARLAEGESFDVLLAKTREFNRWAVALKKVDTDLVMQAKRFYGAKREYATGNWSIPATNGVRVRESLEKEHGF
ncbi:MAG TPA: hypothetical protein VJ825_06470 [Gemmatimonadaceae bacterium]|nr:hypothetical protein [Gemmatimonadaceae bacterium]